MDQEIKKGWASRRLMFAGALACVVCVAIVLVLAQRPRRASQPAGVADGAGPKRITVGRGGDFQTALDQARPGDTILLEAGASYTGSFVLPVKQSVTGTDADYITIRTATADSALPDAHTRLNPSAHAPLLARLLSPASGKPVIYTAAGAHHYRFLGIEFAPADSSARISNLIVFGDGSSNQNSLSQVPHHLIIDRCYLHALRSQEVRRGVALNSGETWIINSWLEGFKSSTDEAQAVNGWNGPGPFHLLNNYLEGAGENVMFGGSDPSIPNLVPSDIEIKGNLIAKPLSWKADDPSYAGQKWVVKNLLELKNAQRVRIEGNVIENCWRADQGGAAIILTPRNQGGTAPWCVVREVVITNNIIRHTNDAIGMLSQDDEQKSQTLSGVSVVNNLLYDIDRKRWGAGGSGGFFVSFNGAGASDISIKNNTAVNTGTGLLMESNVRLRNLIVTDNIMHFPILGGDKGGTEALQAFVAGWQVRRNAIVIDENRDYWASLYPPDNFYPSSFVQVGFVDLNRADLRLNARSSLRGKATGGRDVGCDFNQLARFVDAQDAKPNAGR